MPIWVEWDSVLADVVVKTYVGAWTWAEFDAADQQIKRLIENAPGRLDIIVDLQQNIQLPPGVTEHMRRFVANLSPRQGISVVVGKPFTLEVMMILARQIPDYGKRYYFARSVDEARAMIEDDRDGNPPPPISPAPPV